MRGCSYFYVTNCNKWSSDMFMRLEQQKSFLLLSFNVLTTSLRSLFLHFLAIEHKNISTSAPIRKSEWNLPAFSQRFIQQQLTRNTCRETLDWPIPPSVWDSSADKRWTNRLHVTVKISHFRVACIDSNSVYKTYHFIASPYFKQQEN